MLHEVRTDMDRINRPSWQPNGPRSPGQAKFGKFTAAQWRTFCLINLPVTVVRLWGNAAEGSNERRYLDNFMHLVTAVKLATMNRLTESRIQRYEYHIREYLSTLLELFPKTTITPYQHLSLHFSRQLRDFGPVHAWRCFAFERYNYLLQSLTTNNKFGELICKRVSTFAEVRTIPGRSAGENHVPQVHVRSAATSHLLPKK